MTQTTTIEPSFGRSLYQWFQPVLLCSGLLIVLPAVVTRGFYGKSAAEKYLTATAQPMARHPEWWQDKRCAVITSAYHMPRAMRLAKKFGIRADPIPSHFRSPSENKPITSEDFLPKADNLADFHDLFKEWMAGIVGR